ncbi:MAG: hypothetical protein HS126_22150 [Anaerolineales bacterium]|nr:hypothetical protein [Anaerolineales bacterium]
MKSTHPSVVLERLSALHRLFKGRLDDGRLIKIYPKMLIGPDHRADQPLRPPAIGGTDEVYRIVPREGYSLVEGLPCYALWNFEYELLERPRHQCTNPRCGDLFTLAPGCHDRCPTCTYPVKEVPQRRRRRCLSPITDTWTLAVIGCEEEGVTLDACLIFVPPGTDMARSHPAGRRAGIPHLPWRPGVGPDFDPDDIQVDTLFAYVG